MLYTVKRWQAYLILHLLKKESFVFNPSELRTKVLYFSIEGLRSSISRPFVEEVYDLLIMSLYGSSHSSESKESGFVYFIVPSCKSGQGRILMPALVIYQPKFCPLLLFI